MSCDSPVPAPVNDSAKPVPRLIDYEWMSLATWNQKFQSHVAIAAKGGVDLLLLGDSITEGWVEGVWNAHFGGYRSANFGIGGDATQNLLWRLENGCIGTLQPKVIVLLIGVNNLGREQHSPCDTVRGVGAILARLRSAWPDAKILLFSLFPSDASPQSEFRRRIVKTNALLSHFDDSEKVFVKDIGQVFLEADGTISPTIMADFLHLTEEGYRRWAAQLAPLVMELMKA